MLKLLTLFFWLTAVLFALPQGVEKAITHSGIPKADISLIIKHAGESTSEIASLNAHQIRKPASVIKVLTLYATLLELGFDHRWKTSFYYTGTLHDGVIDGDLIIKGYGDPTLGSKDIGQIIDALRAKGIKKINGHIVIDRSFFHVGGENSSHFDEHTYSPYNAMPDAMMFNERVSVICIRPRENAVIKKGMDQSYDVVDKLVKLNVPCRGRYAWPGIKIDPTAPKPKVYLRGKISKKCAERRICKVITKPYLSFYYALKEAMKNAGIAAPGTLRLAKLPHDATLLFHHYSPPLESILAKTAKKSDNLFARHLLLYLGAKHYGAPATMTKGRAAVREVLKAHGIMGTERLTIDNGSGLSRSARLDADLLANVLDHAYTHYGNRWMNLLSIAGVDGTIKRRFRGTVVKNRAWMKTGTLKRVKNIAGYVKNQQGKLYTVVILVNTNRGRWKASQLQNEIISWLVRYKEPRSTQTPVVEDTAAVPTEENVDTQVVSSSGIERYYVQAGAFSVVPPKAFLLQLEKLSLPYRVKYTDKYRVMVGPYIKEDDARRALQKVRAGISKEAFILKDE
ncbi:MAG: D-alanyl-D-alanine carboxypeptidase/D-alanyl-D-alanine-endopeptidase [Sulfurovum sp.]|nr:MAG: D-alanyl-D-alanine carboxypeptidase/D-alanyl-D-alanine-endopeptidase [Sulfurovum sp.]